jgi:hypothetical protein
VLVDLKALFAFVARYQLNLYVGQAFGRQVGQHLMAEQMRVQRLRNAGLFAIALHNLLDSAWRSNSRAKATAAASSIFKQADKR